MVYELNNWTKNCLFDTFKLTRKAIKSNFIDNDWGFSYDGASKQSYGKEFAWNVIIFGGSFFCIRLKTD